MNSGGKQILVHELVILTHPKHMLRHNTAVAPNLQVNEFLLARADIASHDHPWDDFFLEQTDAATKLRQVFEVDKKPADHQPHAGVCKIAHHA